ncbi:YfjI family protein [Desulfobaculum senezii]
MKAKPLPRLREVASTPRPFPTDKLGPVLASAALHLMNAHQIPAPLCAQTLLTAASFAAQSIVQLEHDGRESGCGLYAITAAKSGTGKSTASRAVMAPFKQFQMELTDRYHAAKEGYDQAKALFEHQKLSIIRSRAPKKQEALKQLGKGPQPPRAPVIVTSDPTMEGLNRLLHEGYGTLILHSDESARLTHGYSMKNDNRLKMAASWSSIWDRETSDVVRVSRPLEGSSHGQLAIHLMGQPAIIEALLNDKDLEDQGFLNRCLLYCAPDTGSLLRYKSQSPRNGFKTQQYNERMLAIIHQSPIFKTGPKGFYDLRTLSLPAPDKGLYGAYHNSLVDHQENTEDYSRILPFIKRAAEIALRIAGVLTVIDEPSATEINPEAFSRATCIMDWYIEERLRIVSQVVPTREILNAEKIFQWLTDNDITSFTLEDIYKGPIREGVVACRAAVKILLNHGYIAKLPEGLDRGGKHCKEAYVVVKRG